MVKPTLEKARQYAYQLIGYRPRSQKELEKRLKEKGYSEEIIASVIGNFKEEGLIDDRHFAQLWLTMRSQTSGRGISLIRRELLSKEIDREIVDEVITEARKNLNEEEIARQLIKRRLRQVAGPDSQKKKERLYGFLNRRGFSSEVIYKLLQEL